MMCKNHLTISGGSTKIQAMWTLTKRLIDSGFKPDIIDGISSGGLLLIVAALYSRWKTHPVVTRAETVFSEIHKDNFWKIKPGSFRSILRAATLRESIGIMRLDEIIQKVVSELDFEEYKKANYPDCITMTVNEKTGKREFVNLKECNYHEFVQAIVATSSIPVFTPSVSNHVDGGIRDHGIGYYVMKRYFPKNTVAIWSRPANLQNVLRSKNANWLQRALNAYQILIFEISKKNEEDQREFSQIVGINYKSYHLPNVLKGMYDTDRNRLKELNEAAKNITL